MHHAPDPHDTERILVYGPPGTGKSSIVKSLVEDGQEVVAFDTESTYRRMLANTTPNRSAVEIINMVHEVPASGEDEWGYLMGRLDVEIQRATNDGDNALGRWLIIDSFTPTWEWCQASYITHIHGEDDINYFLQRRKEMERAEKMGNPLDGNHDWTYINKMYAGLYNRLLRWPGHVLITAEGAKIDDRDSRETQKEFGAAGWKPKGQKRLGHIPKTVLLLGKRTGGVWVYDTVKDREREEFAGVEIEREEGGFVSAYLRDVAGWTRGDDVDKGNEGMTARERAMARARKDNR